MHFSYPLLGLVALTSLHLSSGQSCTNGLDGVNSDGSEICCEAGCGTCGGSGCAGRPGGADACCHGPIGESEIFCSDSQEAPCIMDVCDTDMDCSGLCCDTSNTLPICVPFGDVDDGEECTTKCDCISQECTNGVCVGACPPGVDMCDDPHMRGLRGQKIDWSGVDGGWYCLVTDDNANLHVNVRLTAPLPEEFPNRQLITGVSVMSEGHSLAIEVTNPYNADTDGCPGNETPCLADGGLRTIVDGKEVDGLLRSSRDKRVADDIYMSASNLPVECRQFGGDKVWARMFEEMQQGRRQLAAEERFEDWVLRFDTMAAPDWCTQYITQHDLTDVQSNHAIFKIVTPAVTVRLNVGTNFQGNGELDWDGRVLPDLEFWQMDVGLHGLSVESDTLSGILGETARPVLDEDGIAIMEGYDAFRGTVEDYRVSGALGTDFALLNQK